MHRPILCGIDESAEALVAARLADTLARSLDAPLVLAHAVPAVHATDGWIVLGPFPQQAYSDPAQARERRHGEALLERVAGRLHLADETETLLLVGNAATALLESAAAADAAAVVVGARGHGRVHRALLGSVSARLASGASCPVVIAPHHMDTTAPLATGPIVCGVDGSEHAEHGALVAAAVAERLQRELVLVHVPQAGVALDAVARREGWALLVRVAERIAVPARLAMEAPSDDVAAVLSERAREEGAGFLVIGSRGHGTVRSALLGSVSAGAAAVSRCPVVVVPPGAHAIADAASQAMGPRFRPDGLPAPASTGRMSDSRESDAERST